MDTVQKASWKNISSEQDLTTQHFRELRAGTRHTITLKTGETYTFSYDDQKVSGQRTERGLVSSFNSFIDRGYDWTSRSEKFSNKFNELSVAVQIEDAKAQCDTSLADIAQMHAQVAQCGGVGPIPTKSELSTIEHQKALQEKSAEIGDKLSELTTKLSSIQNKIKQSGRVTETEQANIADYKQQIENLKVQLDNLCNMEKKNNYLLSDLAKRIQSTDTTKKQIKQGYVQQFPNNPELVDRYTEQAESVLTSLKAAYTNQFKAVVAELTDHINSIEITTTESNLVTTKKEDYASFHSNLEQHLVLCGKYNINRLVISFIQRRDTVEGSELRDSQFQRLRVDTLIEKLGSVDISADELAKEMDELLSNKTTMQIQLEMGNRVLIVKQSFPHMSAAHSSLCDSLADGFLDPVIVMDRDTIFNFTPTINALNAIVATSQRVADCLQSVPEKYRDEEKYPGYKALVRVQKELNDLCVLNSATDVANAEKKIHHAERVLHRVNIGIQISQYISETFPKEEDLFDTVGNFFFGTSRERNLEAYPEDTQRRINSLMKWSKYCFEEKDDFIPDDSLDVNVVLDDLHLRAVTGCMSFDEMEAKVNEHMKAISRGLQAEDKECKFPTVKGQTYEAHEAKVDKIKPQQWIADFIALHSNASQYGEEMQSHFNSLRLLQKIFAQEVITETDENKAFLKRTDGKTWRDLKYYAEEHMKAITDSKSKEQQVSQKTDLSWEDLIYQRMFAQVKVVKQELVETKEVVSAVNDTLVEDRQPILVSIVEKTSVLKNSTVVLAKKAAELNEGCCWSWLRTVFCCSSTRAT